MSDCGDQKGRATPDDHDGREVQCVRAGSSTRSERSWRSMPAGRRPALLTAVAALVAIVALGLPGSGCLNPRPEELPSADLARPGTPEPSPEPARETCDDNPLLGGCSLPDQDINGNPVSEPSPEAPNSAAGMTPEPADPSDEEAAGGAAGAGGGDAGSDVPADASAP